MNLPYKFNLKKLSEKEDSQEKLKTRQPEERGKEIRTWDRFGEVVYRVKIECGLDQQKERQSKIAGSNIISE
jgi:hypothetical protein